MERRLPTFEEVQSYFNERNNWGRWGDDDDVGAVNLITPEVRIEAAKLVVSGRTVSLSRPFPKEPAPWNPTPAEHWMYSHNVAPDSGYAADYLGIAFHGSAATHLDAISHIWNYGRMYNGRDPAEEITFHGAKFGGVDKWADAIVTRGVLLDVPKFRNEPYVTEDRPVHGWELEDIAKAQGVSVRPGDALVVYSGRDACIRARPDDHPWLGRAGSARPGLHVSCMPFIRDHDICILVWDMMDCNPKGYDIPWAIHAAISSYGVGLVDNALLEPLAIACAEEGRYEFMLTIAPLKVVGGTGSPVNPIAVL